MLSAKVPLKDTKSVVRPLVTAILRRMLSAKKGCPHSCSPLWMPKEYPLPKVTHLIANLQRPHQKALTPWKRLSHSKKICSPSEEGKRQALERWNRIKLCNSQNSNQQLSPEDWHQNHQCSQERGRTQSRGKRMRSQTSHDVKKSKQRQSRGWKIGSTCVN